MRGRNLKAVVFIELLGTFMQSMYQQGSDASVL